MVATLLLPAGVTSVASFLFKDENDLLNSSDDKDKVYIEQILPAKMYYNLKELPKEGMFHDIKVMFMTVFAILGKKYEAPTYVPMVRVGKALVDGDSIQYMEMNNVYVYPQPTFKDEKQRQQYNRLVYNVKKVLPIAKECHDIIIETYEYLETLPDKKARDEHLKLVEEDIKRT